MLNNVIITIAIFLSLMGIMAIIIFLGRHIRVIGNYNKEILTDIKNGLKCIKESKQLIIIWIMCLLVILLCLFPPLKTGRHGIYHDFVFAERGAISPGDFVIELMPVLIICGLLIYTFRDKHKK